MSDYPPATPTNAKTGQHILVLWAGGEYKEFIVVKPDVEGWVYAFPYEIEMILELSKPTIYTSMWKSL